MSRIATLENRNDRSRALETVLGNLEKQFGKGTIWQMDENQKIEPVAVHSTGCLGLDLALGIGGLPEGRVVEIFGPESSGKTTMMLEVIAGVQKRGGTAAYIDAEHALDLTYARNLGVDIARLLISQPDSGEQALEIADALARSGAVDLIVVDSVAALVPKAELEGDMGDQHVGLQARLMSQALRKLTAVAARGRGSSRETENIPQKLEPQVKHAPPRVAAVVVVGRFEQALADVVLHLGLHVALDRGAHRVRINRLE